MSSVRSAALGFFVGAGSRGEQEAEAGLSHFLEHLLFRGTDRYGSAQIDQLFDGWGAELNAGTDKETTTVYARMLDQHLPAAVRRHGRHDLAPRVPRRRSERLVVLEEIAMYEDDPQDTVFDVLGTAVFGDHPLGRAIIGRAPVIRDTPVQAISDFHARRYVPAPSSSRRRARSTTAPSWRSRAARYAVCERREPRRSRPGAAAAARAVRFQSQGDRAGAHVCLGGPGLSRADERPLRRRVLDAIFGGLSSSRCSRACGGARLAYASTRSRATSSTRDRSAFTSARAGQPRRGDAGRRAELRACASGP
jgi:predicted Zn-dependent peptidase